MKLILDPKDLTEGFFEETRLLGIMAPMKDYLFCWHVNNFLSVDFRINNEIEIQLRKRQALLFCCLRIHGATHITCTLSLQQSIRWRVFTA